MWHDAYTVMGHPCIMCMCVRVGRSASCSNICPCHTPGWSMDIVELCKKYRHEGVVAIDLAGDESLNCEANSEHRDAYEVSTKTDCRTTTDAGVCAVISRLTCL